MPDKVALLRSAIEFFEADPARRTHHSMAKDAGGDPVAPTNPAATCWCALGRFAVELNLPGTPYLELDDAFGPDFCSRVVAANDDHIGLVGLKVLLLQLENENAN